jgi:hypothetical protein
MEIGLSPLGEYFIFINNPKHQALRCWVYELLCQSACLCCASAPMLRVAKRRYHEPLGRYTMPRFTGASRLSWGLRALALGASGH